MQWPATHKYEPLQELPWRFVSRLAVADASMNWPQEARDYLQQIRDLLPADASVKKLSDELTDGIKHPLSASLPFSSTCSMTTPIRPSNSAAAHAFRRSPRMSSETATAIARITPFCSASSWNPPASRPNSRWCSSGDGLFDDVPSLDQFNHMIVYAPQLRRRFFDCTDKNMNLSLGVPFGLQGRKALVLDDAQGGSFVDIGEYPAGKSEISSQRQIQIVNQTDLDIRETISATGYCTRHLRAQLPRGRRAIAKKPSSNCSPCAASISPSEASKFATSMRWIGRSSSRPPMSSIAASLRRAAPDRRSPVPCRPVGAVLFRAGARPESADAVPTILVGRRAQPLFADAAPGIAPRGDPRQ